jgi:anti-sigma regulatory factor (Ser/Thr protein kinase)
MPLPVSGAPHGVSLRSNSAEEAIILERGVMVLAHHPQVLSLELPALPASVAEARSALDSFAGIPDAVRQDARLLLSELVTNSIRHAGLDTTRSIRLELAVERSSLRVDVIDEGLGFGTASSGHHDPTGPGWGLALVARIADRWGVVEGDGVTTVWFELGPPTRAVG